MSALKGEGGMNAAEKAAALAQSHQTGNLPHVFTGSVEHALAHIEESLQNEVTDNYLCWYAIKIFERDEADTVTATAPPAPVAMAGGIYSSGGLYPQKGSVAKCEHFGLYPKD